MHGICKHCCSTWAVKEGIRLLAQLHGERNSRIKQAVRASHC